NGSRCERGRPRLALARSWLDIESIIGKRAKLTRPALFAARARGLACGCGLLCPRLRSFPGCLLRRLPGGFLGRALAGDRKQHLLLPFDPLASLGRGRRGTLG